MDTALVHHYGGMMLAVVKANADTTAVLLTETDVQMVLLGRTFFKVTPPVVMADMILVMHLGIGESAGHP